MTEEDMNKAEFIRDMLNEDGVLPKNRRFIKIKYTGKKEPVNVRRVSMSKLNMTDYVQELLANLVEAVVDMHELPNGDMSMDQGAELVRIGDRLAKLLDEFVEDKTC